MAISQGFTLGISYGGAWFAEAAAERFAGGVAEESAEESKDTD
jgi:hypothetical protein